MTSSVLQKTNRLQRDIDTLSFELSQMIERRGGYELQQLFEQALQLSRARRGGDAAAEEKLKQLIAGLDEEIIPGLIRSLACFFDLANIAEDRHRVRVLRERERTHYPAPVKESIGAAIAKLKHDGFSPAHMQKLLDQLNIEMVFTAHPTEAKRATVRNTLKRLRHNLSELYNLDALPREVDMAMLSIQTDLGCLWETDSLRPNKPTVIEEVRRSLFLAKSLWAITPQVYRSMRRALEANYPTSRFHIPDFLRFGTWIGGDRDGNPFVTPEVTAEALSLVRNKAILHHLEEIETLLSVITVSSDRQDIDPIVVKAVQDALDQYPEVHSDIRRVSPTEIYRHWLRIIRWRLNQTLQSPLTDEPLHGAYKNHTELLDNALLIQNALIKTDHTELAEGAVQDWLDRIRVFGFHLTSLDIREDSQQLHRSIDELLKQMGIHDNYMDLSEEEKCNLLTSPTDFAAAEKINAETLSEDTRKTFELFELVHRIQLNDQSQILGALVISMTHHPSDILTMYWLSQMSAARYGSREFIRLPIVPLFETIADLNNARDILNTLFDITAYRQHVEELENRQILMIGYSDSTKDGGFLAANWGLYQAQREMALALRPHGIDIMLFHGRGGAIGRGGGPAARGIMALPPESVNGKLRVTEQGEILSERYDDPNIAFRHLEQVTWATLLVSAKGEFEPESEWTKIMDEASEQSINCYRGLIQDENFVDYFRQATPIAGIETLPIGSRPSRRRTQKSLSDLRAIPYTFAWTQSRHMLTAFFGMGDGLSRFCENDQETLRAMYENWPFFRAFIDNAELGLVKADMDIASQYADQTEDIEVGKRIFQKIQNDYHKAQKAVLTATGQSRLLDKTSWLYQSLETRNPYIDPLNMIQIDLLGRLREASQADQDVDQDKINTINSLLRQSIQGVAAGMRTTG